MAMGCVPVAVNSGGVSKIIQNDVNGYLVNSPDEMGYPAIRLLFSNDIWRRMSTAASTRANHFSREAFHKKIEGLFLNE